jgi:hypothetical protein
MKLITPDWAGDGKKVTVTSSAPASDYPAWSSGVALAAGVTRYDSVDGADYSLLVDVTGAENTVRPSEAVASTDEVISSRWVRQGAANIYRAFDSRLLERSSGASPFTLTAISLGHSNSIALFGVSGTTSVSVVVTQSGQPDLTLTTPDWGSLSSGVMRWDHTLRWGATYQVTLTGTEPAIAEIAGGRVLNLAEPLRPLNRETTHYSAMDFDPVYGLYSFVKRGYAAKLSGSARVRGREGFWVEQQLIAARARPAVFDLNSKNSEDGRILFGVATRFSRTDAGLAELDTIDFELAGMVEDIL